MADIYQSFLRSPSASQLAPNAALHYITTTTSIGQPDKIIKHLQAQGKEVEKKGEKVLNIIESSNGVCLETETTYKFVNSGGVILPGIDENLVADMTVVCAMVHIVQIDADQKISQIRLYWDQSTMLKQVEAIGKTGRNWPIRDGPEQAKLVAQSVKASGSSQSGPRAAPANGNSSNNSNIAAPVADEPQSKPGKSAQDFHSRLFATGDGEERRSIPQDPSAAPRESAKPQPRQWDDMFPGEGSSLPDRSASPGIRSPHQPILKAGAGKNFQADRIFDEESSSKDRGRSPGAKRQDPTKFDHFEFGNGNEEEAPVSKFKVDSQFKQNSKKAASHFSFEDSDTPEKMATRPNYEQQRHFGYGIDDEDPDSPPKRNLVHAPRPDANPHFEITDQNSPAAANKQSVLNNVTNVNSERRHNEMDNHYVSEDKSPSAIENRNPAPAASKPKQRSDQTSSWSFSDMMEDTPVKNQKIYKTYGDGMGGRAGSRLWEIGGDEEATAQYGAKGGEKQVYKTAGNGMGGKKGTGLSWSIGDDDDA